MGSVEWQPRCEFKGFRAQSERTKRPSWSCLRAEQICCVRTFQTGSKINTASAPSQTIQPPKKAERVNDSASSVLLDLHLSERLVCATNLRVLRMLACTKKKPLIAAAIT